MDNDLTKCEKRSFLVGRDPSVDRCCRPRPERKVCLFPDSMPEGESDIEEYEVESSEEDVDTDSQPSCIAVDPSPPNTAIIYLRLRPVDQDSTAYSVGDDGKVLIVKPQGTSTSSNKNMMEKHFSFSTIFEASVNQRNVYEMCVEQRVQSEESFTVLTYGTSGSGKTFTLLGDLESPGIVPRSLVHLFTLYHGNIYPNPALKFVNGRITFQDVSELAKDEQRGRQLLEACSNMQSQQHLHMQETVRGEHNFQTTVLREVSVLIWVSFVEIYNENVFDLLAPIAIANTVGGPPPSKNMKIVGNNGKVFIKDLTSVYVKSSLDAISLLKYGLQRVNYATTAINAHSSRSHCIFMVDVIKYGHNDVVSQLSYKFCDLAGSERLEKTDNIGHRMREAQRINTSLMVLGRCIDASNSNVTRSKKKNDVIPYRESKLTMLLQAALLGKEKLCMIVNVTPSVKFYEENLTVLNFSSLAKNIVFRQPVIKHNKSRYSFIVEHSEAVKAAANIDNDVCFVQIREKIKFLVNELSLKEAELDQLKREHTLKLERLEQELRDQLKREHTLQLEQLEQELRNQLVNSCETLLNNQKVHAARVLAHELKNSKSQHESEIAALKRHYENKIEDLREELEESEDNAKKQRISH